MEIKETKIILTGEYEYAQIRALLPSFILTQEAQKTESKIRNKMDFEIIDFHINQKDNENREVIVKWRPNKQ